MFALARTRILLPKFLPLFSFSLLKPYPVYTFARKIVPNHPKTLKNLKSDSESSPKSDSDSSSSEDEDVKDDEKKKKDEDDYKPVRDRDSISEDETGDDGEGGNRPRIDNKSLQKIPELKEIVQELTENVRLDTTLESAQHPQNDYGTRFDENLTYGQEYYILHREEILKKIEEKRAEAKFGDFPSQLVRRPEKGFLWGVGAQVYENHKNIFEYGKLPTIRQVIKFLEVNQVKDISVVNVRELGKLHLPSFSIISTGFSCRHIYKVGRELVSEVRKLNVPEIVNLPHLYGSRDDEWLIIDIKEISVHLFLEEYREEIDLEFNWKNPITKELQEEQDYHYDLIMKRKKGRKVFKR